MVEADTDSNPATEPTGSRRTFYTYNSTYPGLIAEVRKLSELKPTGTCTTTVTTDCARTIYAYDSDGRLTSTERKGFTYNSSGTVISFDYTTTITRGTFGQITKIEGPRGILGGPDIDDDIEFSYHDETDPLLADYPNEVKRKLDATTYLTTTYADYDPWGVSRRKSNTPMEIGRAASLTSSAACSPQCVVR